MKVIHSSAWYFPDSTGGTEVYVDHLTRELDGVGVQNKIVAPCLGVSSSDYSYHKIDVHRYPVNSDVSDDGVAGFKKWIQDEDAEIYHQHSWSFGCSLPHLKAAKDRKLATVITVHLPNLFCSRGTMMLFGRDSCDGFMEENRCTACWIQSRGMPSSLASILSMIPERMSDFLSYTPIRKAKTLFSMKRLIRNRCSEFAEMVSCADRVIVVSKWLYGALRSNGVPEPKIYLCRHGYPGKIRESFTKERSTPRSKILEIGYLGRWSSVKGIDVLIEAFRRIPLEIPVRLTLHGVENDLDDKANRQKLLPLIARDQRVVVKEAIPHGSVVNTIKSFDVLAVPSQVMETGPYVVLEALAAGVPVLGSDLGGIAEWVKHGINGVLIPFNQPDAWRDVIIHLAKDRTELEKLSCFGNVRTMKDVAIEMKQIYASLLASNEC